MGFMMGYLFGAAGGASAGRMAAEDAIREYVELTETDAQRGRRLARLAAAEREEQREAAAEAERGRQAWLARCRQVQAMSWLVFGLNLGASLAVSVAAFSFAIPIMVETNDVAANATVGDVPASTLHVVGVVALGPGCYGLWVSVMLVRARRLNVDEPEAA